MSLIEKIGKILVGRPFITAKHFKRKYYDLTIANGEFGFGIPKQKCLVVFHGSLKGYAKSLGSYITLKQRLSLFRGHCLQYIGSKGKYCVAVSDYAKIDLERYGIRVSEVIENCIDTELFCPSREDNRSGFLCVAAYDYYRKGFDILSKIANRINGDFIDVVTKTDDTIEGLKIIPGGKNEEMPLIYNKYKIFLFPSRYEALQLAPLEAMSCGVPVVISDVGLGPHLKRSIPDFVVSGFGEKAIEDYEKKIKKILMNYSYYAQIARDYVIT